MACGLPRVGANKIGLTRDKRDTDLIHDYDTHLIKVNSVAAFTKQVDARGLFL